MEFRVATAEDEHAWDAYVLQHPDGLAYQLFAWQRAIRRAYGFKHQSVLAERDGKICGLLPLIDFRIPLAGSAMISLPYCDVGGVLADDDEISAALINYVERTTVGRCQLRSISEIMPHHANLTDKVRMVLELPDSADKFLASLKSKVRNKIKKPLKNGYRVELGSAELIESFYAVFTQNMRELGSPVHSRIWIEAIVAEYKEKVRIAVVYSPEGLPVAGGIIILHPVTVSNPWASSLRHYNHMKVNMLLYSALLSYAADNGFKKFDFGRSTPREGTYRFKEQWGAKPRQLFWYELSAEMASGQETKSVTIFNTRKIVTTLWQKLPLSVANFLGPRLRKYIAL